MSQVYRLDGITPVVDPTAYVHPSAVLIGDVIVGPGCYIGPCASLRGDFGRIVLERGCNLQDTCVMHGFPGDDTVIGADGHIGHGAVLHGCTIGPNALVGMRSVIMDGAVIGEAAVVGAMSFVKARFELPARHLAQGVPARVVRELSAEEIAWKAQGTQLYQDLTRRCRESMTAVEALPEPEPNRARMPVAPFEPLHRSRRK